MAHLRTGLLRIITHADLHSFNTANDTHVHNRPIESARIGPILRSAEKIS